MSADAALTERLRARVSPADPADSLSDVRRHRRAEDGAGNAPGDRGEYRYGSGSSADGPGGFDGGLPALGAHRAARGDGVSADALRDGGDVLREPVEVAAGYPQGAAHDSAGAAAHVGADLFHHLHRVEQASCCRRGKRSRPRWRWRWRRRATGARASAFRGGSAVRYGWPTG